MDFDWKTDLKDRIKKTLIRLREEGSGTNDPYSLESGTFAASLKITYLKDKSNRITGEPYNMDYLICMDNQRGYGCTDIYIPSNLGLSDEQVLELIYINFIKFEV